MSIFIQVGMMPNNFSVVSDKNFVSGAREINASVLLQDSEKFP
jgi:hypothetical protein